MAEKTMNEIAPWGQSWGRTSKSDYRKIVTNLSIDIQQYKAVLYFRDLFYNPCHDLDRAVELSKEIDNFEV